MTRRKADSTNWGGKRPNAGRKPRFATLQNGQTVLVSADSQLTPATVIIDRRPFGIQILLKTEGGAIVIQDRSSSEDSPEPLPVKQEPL